MKAIVPAMMIDPIKTATGVVIGQIWTTLADHANSAAPASVNFSGMLDFISLARRRYVILFRRAE
jgi:hypothetical protein